MMLVFIIQNLGIAEDVKQDHIPPYFLPSSFHSSNENRIVL